MFSDLAAQTGLQQNPLSHTTLMLFWQFPYLTKFLIKSFCPSCFYHFNILIFVLNYNIMASFFHFKASISCHTYFFITSVNRYQLLTMSSTIRQVLSESLIFDNYFRSLYMRNMGNICHNILGCRAMVYHQHKNVFSLMLQKGH